MKLPLLLASSLLVACTNQQAYNKTPAEISSEIKAFVEICLKTGPSFSTADKAASVYGVSDYISLGEGKLGFNNDKSLGVQIKPNKECAITTPSKKDKNLTSTFIQAVSSELSTSTPRRVPFQAIVNGQKFIFTHHRRGGEAYVMLKKGENK